MREENQIWNYLLQGQFTYINHKKHIRVRLLSKKSFTEDELATANLKP